MTKITDCVGIKCEEAIPWVEGMELNLPSLNCQIEPSKLTCLIGPERIQLRAYLHMLAGILKPSQGLVEVCGSNISKLDQSSWKQLRRKVGYLSGSAPLLSTQHGLMNVMLPALYHDNDSFQETAQKARMLLEELNCQFELTLIPALLTGFQRSQVAMARALILDPSVLILDVPFYDLGAKERERMADMLAKYQQNRAVVMIGGLQYPHFLEQHVSQIIYISETKIASFNSWRSFKNTEDSDIRELLSAL